MVNVKARTQNFDEPLDEELTLMQKVLRVKRFVVLNKHKCFLALIILMAIFAYFKPNQFADLWLTKNQQGQLLFNLGYYDKAATKFNDTRWQAFSFYGAEQFEQSATLYSQFNTKEDMLARANALAHSKRYVKARDMYQAILEHDASFESAQTNLTIVQDIIDSVNLMSESQKAENGDSPKELGDEPQRGDGADKKEARKQVVEQLSAEQLLLDPKLNEMWLRQVQKNPAQFLSFKFQMQAEQDKADTKLNGAKVQKTPNEADNNDNR